MRITLTFVLDAFSSFLSQHGFVAVTGFSKATLPGQECALFRSEHFELMVSTFRSDIEVSVRSSDSSGDWYEAPVVVEMLSGEPAQILDEHTLPVLISRMEATFERLVEFLSPGGSVLRDQFLRWSEEQYWMGVRSLQAAKAEEKSNLPWWKFW